jgi:hypothetical protein
MAVSAGNQWFAFCFRMLEVSLNEKETCCYTMMYGIPMLLKAGSYQEKDSIKHKLNDLLHRRQAWMQNMRTSSNAQEAAC